MKKTKGYMIVYRYKEVSHNQNVIGYIDEILGFTESEEVALKVARNFIKRQMTEIRNTQVKNCVKIKRIRVSDDRILGHSADGRSNTNVNEDDCIPFAVVLTTRKRLEHIVSVCDSTEYK